MPENLPLFMEDVYEALRGAVNALGGPKEVGVLLWPKLPVNRARQDLLDCLNPDNPRKLDIEEVMMILRLAKKVGFHGAKHWIDKELGYEPSKVASEAVQINEIGETLNVIAERLDRTMKQLVKVRELHDGVPASLLKRA